MAFDPLDVAVLCCLVASVVLYSKKDKIISFLRGSEALDPLIGVSSNGSKDLLEIIEANKKDFLILYGSQTGTAEDYCKKFAKELHSRFKELHILCGDFDNFDFEDPNTLGNLVGKVKCLVIFMSTYGEGELPDPCANFDDYLNNVLESDELKNLPIMIFGLGNSTYEFFNGAAMKLKEKLVDEAGAKLIGQIGAADDSIGNTEEEYVSWKDAAFELIEQEFNLKGGENLLFEPMYEYINYNGADTKVFKGELNKNYLSAEKDKKHIGPFDQSYPFLAEVSESKELCNPVSGRNCVHVEFDISSSNIKYETGDHLGVIPQNAQEHVSNFLQTLNLNADEVFDLHLKDPTSTLPFPVPTNIETAVTNYLEITGPVSRQTISQIVQFIPESEESIRQRLVEISSSAETFHKEIIEAHLNFADCLQYVSSTFNWGQYIPWTFLLETIPSLKPRFYSISSSNLYDNNKIHITAMVEVTDADKLVGGVTTNLLNEINKGSNSKSLPLHYNLSGPRGLYKAESYKLPIFVRKSTFKLPDNADTPVIMIGPGTGVAPFRGFVRDRLVENSDSEMILFYGSRNIDDHLYKEEWESQYNGLSNLKVFNAYSRDPSMPKTYVQKLMLDQKDLIMNALKKGAFVYVCGDAGTMAKQVNDTLISIVSDKQEISVEDAHEMIKFMKLNGRYHEDVW
ncbi:hypothetical protein QEN19_001285 [Hanseniaspora menglaensis]